MRVVSRNFRFFLFIFFIFNQNIWASDSVLSHIENIKNKSLALSPDLKTIEARYNQSRASNYTGLSHHLPALYLNLKRQKNLFESSSPLLASLGLTTPTYQWGIDYQWSLFNYGNFLNTKRNFTASDLEEINYLNSKKEFIVNFNTYLLNFVLAKYKSATISNSISKAETAKREASIGFSLGQKTKIDVLRSEANFVSLNSKKTTYQDEEQSTRSKFIEKTGLEISDLSFLENLNEDQLLAIISDVANYNKINENFNFKATPMYEKLNYDIELNNLDANKLTQSEWPELKIQGSYSNSNDQIQTALNNPIRQHSVALVLTIPLFTGGSLVSSNFEQYFAKKQIAYNQHQKQLELDDNFKNTIIKIHALETLVSSLQLNVSQFEELQRLTSKSYQLGKSTMFELLEVQDNLLDSKINLAFNKIQLYNLAENYNWQTGKQ